MAKQSGLGDRFFVGGVDISGDIGSLGQIGGGPAALDTTDITQSGYSRLGGLLGGRMEMTTYFNPAAARAHPTLKLLPTASSYAMYLRGTGIGSPGACMYGKQINYDPTRAQDGSLTMGVSLQNDIYPLEWGEQLTAGTRTDTTATSPATGLDGTASSANGMQVYAQVFSVTGTSVTLTVQDSADNSAFANLTGGAFTAVLAGAVSAQRLAITGTIRRYVRVISSGTFSNAQFAVVAVRNPIAVGYN